jgi:hypothetical protein
LNVTVQNVGEEFIDAQAGQQIGEAGAEALASLF